MPHLNPVADRHNRDLTAALSSLFRSRVCIVGVGNRMRGDDGAGPVVIERRSPEAHGVWFDAGVAPENFLEPIARANPDVVLLVDAVAFGGVAGDVRLFTASELDSLAISTHSGSLQLVSDYLTARTGADLQVLGIQPGTLEPQDALSPGVDSTCDRLAAMLSELLNNSR